MTAPDVSIHDFTVTVDTDASGGDMLVLRLDRDGFPRLVLPFGAQQLLWAINDPEYFFGGYRTWIATNIIKVHEDQGWSFGDIGRALLVDTARAEAMYQQALVERAKELAAQAQELAEVGV